METPQTFDHDPRQGASGPQKRVTTLHTDPPPGPNPNPGGGQRNIVKLAMKERIRRREAMKSQGTHLDPAVIQAKALVDAAGTITSQEEVNLRLERHQQRQRSSQDIARQKLSQGHDAAAANARMRRRARAERALEQKGLPVNEENLALLIGPEEEAASRPRPLPSNLRGTERPGQNVTPVTPIDTGVLDESQDPNYGGVPVAPVDAAPAPVAEDETQSMPSVAESLQANIAQQLEDERLALIEARQEIKEEEIPTELDEAEARAYLEALGFEISAPQEEPEQEIGKAAIETVFEAAESFAPKDESLPGDSGTEAVEPSE